MLPFDMSSTILQIRVSSKPQSIYAHFFSVGGIHTVIRTKAGVTTNELGDQYCMIGPYHEPTVKLEVETAEPDLSVTGEVIESMRREGVNVRILLLTTPCLLLLYVHRLYI